MNYFADKILSLCCDLPPNLDTVHELEAPWLSPDLSWDTFIWLSQADANRLLEAIQPTMYLLNPIPL